jgi:hypothetical protein
MTQEDLQRDVEYLEEMRVFVGDSVWLGTIDRALETARVLASLTDGQRAQVAEGCAGVATAFASIDPILADAHRKVARLMGGA